MSRTKRFVFHPLTILVIAVLAALLFALLSDAAFQGDLRDLLVYYFAPIGVPFIAFLFDRAERWREVQWVVDIPVVIVSFMRALFPIPFISGHALFLTYAILTTRTRISQITAFIVLIQVAYFKIFLWHDPTLLGGILLGIIASMFQRRLSVRTATIT